MVAVLTILVTNQYKGVARANGPAIHITTFASQSIAKARRITTMGFHGGTRASKRRRESRPATRGPKRRDASGPVVYYTHPNERFRTA